MMRLLGKLSQCLNSARQASRRESQQSLFWQKNTSCEQHPAYSSHAMLCATCLSVFDTNPSSATTVVRGSHHTNIANLKAAAQQGCYLCAGLVLDYSDEEVNDGSAVSNNGTVLLTFELCMSLASPLIGLLTFQFVAEDISSPTYELVYTSSLQKPINYSAFLDNVRADLSSEPWRVRDDGFASSSAAVPKSTGDPDSLKVASKWLQMCLENHSYCENHEFLPASPWYPKRLLDLGSDDGTLRLVETKEHAPEERYATLSHRWGPKRICTLTIGNIGDYKINIPVSILSNTFRDAIAATRMLRVLPLDRLSLYRSSWRWR